MGRALLTDLYELNMAASYLRRGMDAPATFSLFVRALPPNRGFLVAAGLEECLEFLEDFVFDPEDLEYLRVVGGFTDEDLGAFAKLRFQGDVWAVPEGRVVLAGEPLLEVTAPIAQAQLMETYLLNQVTLHTVLASKAARYAIAARGKDLVDFSFRRTHGVDAAMAVARASAMAGFVATSNVEGARRFGLRATGTMAHSYIEAFPSEPEAFRAFARDFPGRTTFLVDTYDTGHGVRSAIEVIRELDLAGRRGATLGVRLDSGDLLALSMEARRLLDEAGLHEVRVFASGGIDETDVERLLHAGAPIDAFGIGTQLGVSADAPALDSVYKLVEYDRRPVLKLSTGKGTAPGPKQVFRRAAFEGDVIGLRDETPPDGTEALLEPAMEGGRRLGTSGGLGAARERLEADLGDLPPSARDLHRPTPPPVAVSEGLEALTKEIKARIKVGLLGTG